MVPDPFDRAARFLLNADEAMLGWFLSLAPDEWKFVGWLDTRNVPWPGGGERVRDTLAHVLDPLAGGLPWAIGGEFSTTPDPDMLSRLMIYLGEARLRLRPTDLPGDRFHVGGVVVNLTGRGNCGQDMHWQKAGLRTWIQPREINLSEKDASQVLDEIESRTAPMALLAFIPLMKGGGEDGIIQRWLSLAQRETAPQRRGHLALAEMFAEVADCLEPWHKALEDWSMIESKVMNEWTRQAVERATQKTEIKTMADAVIDLLEPLGTPPADLVAAIRGVNEMSRLKQFLRLAARTASFEQFRQDAKL